MQQDLRHQHSEPSGGERRNGRGIVGAAVRNKHCDRRIVLVDKREIQTETERVRESERVRVRESERDRDLVTAVHSDLHRPGVRAH